MQINIMAGVPASGKSWHIERNKKPNDIVLSRDKFREYLRQLFQTAEYFPLDRKTELSLWLNHIQMVIDLNKNINQAYWIDATHISPKTLKKTIERLRKIKDVPNMIIDLWILNIPLEECIRRNSLREGFAKVPDKAIHDMHDKLPKLLDASEKFLDEGLVNDVVQCLSPDAVDVALKKFL